MNFIEGDLQFDFSKATAVFRPELDIAGRLQYWKTVDFIIEEPDYYWFIEVKDPDIPNPSKPEEFLKKFQSSQLQQDLVLKYRHSFISQWAAEKVSKPIKYVVLLCMAALQPTELLAQQENLKKSIPMNKLDSWKRPIIDNCLVLNLAAWNKYLSKWPITRISTSQP